MLVLLFPLVSFSQTTSEWETHFERSGFIGTPSYEQTMSYLNKFRMFPQVYISSLGKSPQGRDINYMVISKEGVSTPERAKAAGRPVVMIIAGIHSGEIEGKDALFLLARDILVSKKKSYLLDEIILLIVPIFNVDGHERRSRYNRINQNGPEEMGWRTTAQNLNLNRDWLKADSEEMKRMLRLFNNWLPDFFIDCHTTDGADYQYSVTYGLEKYRNIYSKTAIWNKFKFKPYLESGVRKQGFLISPYVDFKADVPDSGLVEFASPPRLSNGYAAVQNRVALLIETHMMKPYRERVFATRAVINTALEYIYENPDELISLNKEADENTVNEYFHKDRYLPLSFRTPEKHKKFSYLGIEAVKDTSIISGSMKTVYTGVKYEKSVPYYDTLDVTDSVLVPSAYIIPVEWHTLIDRIKLHGIKVETLDSAIELKVKRHKFTNVKFAARSYEGRQSVEFDYENYYETVNLPAGTFYIPTNQRTLRVIAHLLEPKSEDSFVSWGFLNSIFEQKEYFESYVMEKEAREMLKNDRKLHKEFEEKLASDESFRNSPYQRLNFFYERSQYYDKNFRIYPVMVVE